MTTSMGLGAFASTEPVAAEAPRKSGVVHRELGLSAQVRAQHDAEFRALGHEARLRQLLDDHYDSVWRLLRRIGVEVSRVEDAAQEVFIIASRKLDFIELGREHSYLRGTAIRVAANFRRSTSARREVFDSGNLEHLDPKPEADKLLEQKRLRELLDKVLDELPLELRTIFVLFELEGLSVPEIADLTGFKIGTIASRLRRARALFERSVRRLKASGMLEGR